MVQNQIDFDPRRDRYLIIGGNGRSGTNLMLSIADRHPLTYCRNEPNELPGGAMDVLPDGFFLDAFDDEFLARWEDVLVRAAALRGERDVLGATYKGFLGAGPARLEAFLRHRRVRKLLGAVSPSLAPPEWPLPRAHRAPGKVVPVYKLLLVQGWIVETHAHHPGQHVLHVMRDPAGFIRSWMNRYVITTGGGGEAVFRANLVTLDRILEHFGGRMMSGRTYSEAALIESEIWRWRYINETMLERLDGSPRYRVALYRDIKGDPVGTARETFGWLGLDADPDTLARVGNIRNVSFAKRHSETVDDGRIAPLSAHVLKGSRLSEYFPEALKG